MPTGRGYRRGGTPGGERRDSYQEITDLVLAELEKGSCPWREPWRAAGPPRSISTGKRYGGVNVLLLGMSGRHASPFFGTYKAIAELGGEFGGPCGAPRKPAGDERLHVIGIT